MLRVGLLGALCCLWLAAHVHAASRPNMMLVIADDMTWSDCEPYGSTQVKTPHLAELAAQGMKFNRCFTATAMCAPTRQQLYTGLFPVRNGAWPNHSRVYEGTKSVAQHLKQLGYRVGLIGKEHIKPAESYPFEFLAKGNKAGASNVKKIAEFVSRDTQQPYFLIVASNESHKPWDKGDPEQYDAAKLIVPPYLADTPATRQALVRYYAEITYLDRQVGDCMKIVDDSPGREDTIFIFTSEQGCQLPFAGKWTCYDTGLRVATIVRWPRKIRAGSETDAMVQYVDVVPTLIEAAGGVPTEIDTGRPGAEDGGRGFDGRSFLRVMLGEADDHQRHVFGVHTTRGIINGSDSYPIRSVRSTRYKYIRNLNSDATFTNIETRGDGMVRLWEQAGGAAKTRAAAYQKRPPEEFYDLQTDPWELNNLAGEAKYAKLKAGLQVRLAEWMEQQGDLGEETELKANERQGQRKTRPSPKKKNATKKNAKKKKRKQ